MKSIGGITDLLRQRGFEATGEELLDLVWLHHVEILAQPPERGPAPPPPPESSTGVQPPVAGKTPPEPPRPPVPLRPVADGKDGEPAQAGDGDEEDAEQDLLYAPPSLSVDPKTIPGSRVSATAGRALADTLRIARALLPLRERRVATDRRFLDVETMIQRFCRNGGIWEFSPMRKREPGQEVTLVLEQCPSVLFWEAMADELAEVFAGILRLPSRTVYLRFGGAEHPLVATGRYSPGERERVLLQPGRRRLLLVLTDGTSLAWQDGRMGRTLHRWAAIHPTTLVLPFSEDVARRTEFGRSRIAHARVGEFGVSEWAVRPPRAKHPVFLLTLQTPLLAAWTRAIRTQPSGHVAAADLPRAPQGELFAPPGLKEREQSVDGEELLAAFREHASRRTRELASVLAAVPLFPPVMRLVQEVFRQGSSHVEMAEFLYSGLIYRLTDDPDTAPDDVQYEFRNVLPGQRGVREQLREGSTYREVDEVLRTVGSWVGSRFGEEGRRFEALLLGESGGGVVEINDKLRPFAKIFGEVLRGTRRDDLGGLLEAAGNGQVPVIVPPVSVGAPPVPGEKPTPEPEPSPGDRPASLINSVGMTMLGIPSGTFIMGSPDDEPGRDADDFALHQVILSDPFRIAQTPVTQKQWGDVMGTTVEEQKAKGSAYGEVTGTGDDHPVYFVNWEDALRFCDALTDKENRRAEGLAYALPTEAQWEYACRAGTSSPYNVPEVDPTQLGWFAENSGGSTHSVREKMPNAWGLDDCHGNVWEWCADWFERSTSTEAITDPQGPPSGADRVLRGGSWGSVARRCRSASRDRYFPAFRDRDVGFRPVLSPVKQREAQGVLPPEPEAAAQPEPEVQEEAARSVRPHFVPIKGGTFLMGSPETEEGRFDQEDLHQVALTRDFEIADAPVTQAQYEAVMGSNPSQFKDSGPDAPVETVSWEDAVAFCEKLTAEDPEWIYRLPTEAQWEYACRAGTKGRWNVDGADLKDLGWYDENSEKKTHPVRQKQPNAWGLHDCHGNVFEWCQDWFTEHLGATAVTDPQGPEIGIICVLRGGSWRDGARFCRSAYRDWYDPAARDDFIGFRPVRMKKAEGTVPEPVPTQEAEVKAGARSSAWIARDFDVPPAPGMKMLCIGAGDFAMGEGSEAHPVTLTEDFFVAETPVTQAQYEAVMGTNPSHFKQVGPEGPVEQVSWEDAVAFCARLNQIAEPEDGWEWALPTEAQWEYACRAGTTTAFSFGDVLNGTQANCDGNHPEGTEEKGAYLKRTSPVRSYAPNPWGLYDCHGNVWEWCADWYGKYPKEAVADPQGAESGADRVLRGGSWYGEAQRCRSANRLSYTPDYRGNDIGFRPVLTRKKQAEGTEPEPAPTQEAEVKAGARSRRADYVAADFANGLGMGMVCVEPGAFAMGSPVGGEGRESESWMGKETQHPVTLTEPFWIAKTPLTQGIWSTLMGTTVAEQKAKGSAYGEVTGTGDHHPVYFVNWEEALAACDRLSIREREAGRLPDGYLYTLPTEAQWEYACRAGTEGPFNVEGASLQDLGWYADNSGKSTHPTAEKTPNGWGLHDCHGNVWEWCADWYQEDLGAAAATDPKGPESGNRRVLRGGSWSGVAQSCRSASRGRFNPAYRYDFIGFRPVLSPRKQRTDLSVLPAELEAVAQPEPPAPTAAGQIRPVFVPIPAGKFLMGSPENEKGRFDDETQHEVTLTRAFEIADAPVTQAQYEAVMGSNPSRFKESGPDAPVEQVSWEDSVAWCRKMSETDPHYEYRLPTEAEWEYVCRAGTTGPYNVDGADLANLGWFDANSGQKTHSVREKAPNTWGLHECHGNVREWCADRYQKDLGSNAATDPQGPQSGSDRVLRGGSWSSTAQYCRSAFRGGDSPGSRHRHFGFRPVRVKKAEGTVLEAVAQPEPEAGARSPRRGLFGGLFGGKR